MPLPSHLNHALKAGLDGASNTIASLSVNEPSLSAIPEYAAGQPTGGEAFR
jgi:hypothetical protein